MLKDFLFRLKVSLALVWLNACAYRDKRVRQFVWRWLCNGMLDLWTTNLNDPYCCSGADNSGKVFCVCGGMTWRAYWNGYLDYHMGWR